MRPTRRTNPGDRHPGCSRPIALPPNTKDCRVTAGSTGTRLLVRIGLSEPQKIDDAALVSLSYRTAASMPAYDGLELLSREGPMGTSDYRISLEVLAGECTPPGRSQGAQPRSPQDGG